MHGSANISRMEATAILNCATVTIWIEHAIVQSVQMVHNVRRQMSCQ